MDRDDRSLIEAAIVTCAMMGVPVSTRHVQAMTAHLRDAVGLPRHAVWGETIRRFLAEHRDTLAIRQRYATDTASTLKSWLSDTPPIRDRSPRRAAKEKSKPSLNGKVSSTLLPTVGVAADAASLPEWAERIQTRVRALGRREHRTLDHTESFDAAALFAVRFMSRKNRTEEAVRRAALGLIGRMRNVVTNRDHPGLHDLTVRDFFGFAKEAWIAGGKQDLDTPWVVVAFAEAPEKTP